MYSKGQYLNIEMQNKHNLCMCELTSRFSVKHNSATYFHKCSLHFTAICLSFIKGIPMFLHHRSLCQWLKMSPSQNNDFRCIKLNAWNHKPIIMLKCSYKSIGKNCSLVLYMCIIHLFTMYYHQDFIMGPIIILSFK